MQKWEYCVISHLVDDVGTGWHPTYPKLTRFTPSGRQVTDLTRKRGVTPNEWDYVAQLIAQMGEDGWEMVGIYGDDGNGKHGIYFKRPKP